MTDNYHVPSFAPRSPNEQPFLFATGIENSYPVITGPDGRDLRRDEMAECHHYDRWQEDFELTRALGLDYLRYGPPLYRTYLGPGKYDWSFADETFGALHRLGITVIADLCHFGVPDWLGNFQNPDLPEYFAEYARAFARRFPWVRLFTPVNEILVTARFSAQLGWWNERLKSDRAFVTALRNLVRANLRAEEEILQERPDAIFVQSEMTGQYHPQSPAALGRTQFLNEARFFSLDLSYGCDISAFGYQYLTDHGLSRSDYGWFMEHGTQIKSYCVMGNDYYVTNESSVPADEHREPEASGEIYGYYIITKEYFDRYHLPVMHTETNLQDDGRAPTWLWKEWLQLLRLKGDGVPIVGFTWYSLTDQVDWDTALREHNGRVNPVGLFDLDRKIRPVGELYRQVVRDWARLLPMESRHIDMTTPQERAEHERHRDARRSSRPKQIRVGFAQRMQPEEAARERH